MINTPDKTEKDGVSFWLVLTEIFGSIAGIPGVIYFIETITSIFNDGYGVGTAIALPSFILVPAVFALPIIIKRLELLVSPFFVIVIMVMGMGLDNLFFSLSFIGLVLICLLGAATGFLIRSFFSSSGKMKILFITAGILVFLLPVSHAAYTFFGFPLHCMSVNKKVIEYAAENYPGFDLTVGRTTYDWFFSCYETKIYDKKDEDIYFWIQYEPGVFMLHPESFNVVNLP
ncbi:MAG: hypothetical protein LBS21_11095 [Clostridiales bacterium]|nr:hypothetical protein [Clostridiales bacterium]